MSKILTNKEMLEQLLNGVSTINQRLDSIETRVNKLEGSKPKNGKGNNKVVKDNRTWTEKKAEYAKQFSDAERKAYGQQKKAEREIQKKAYEATNKKFKGTYVAKSVWRAEYNKQIEKLSK